MVYPPSIKQEDTDHRLALQQQQIQAQQQQPQPQPHQQSPQPHQPKQQQQQQQPYHAAVASPPAQVRPAAIATHTPLQPPPSMYPVLPLPAAVPASEPASRSLDTVSPAPSVNLPPLSLPILPGRPRDPRLAGQAPYSQPSPTLQQPFDPTRSHSPAQLPALHDTQPRVTASVHQQHLQQQQSPQPQPQTPPQQLLATLIEQLSTARNDAENPSTIQRCKDRMDEIRVEQRILNSKRMELTLNCKKIMDSIPMNENRDILMETLKNEMVANIEANLKRDRELEAEYTSMWSYVKRAEALEADDTTVGARLTSSTSLLSTIAAAGGGGGGGSTGQTDLVWVGPNDVNDLKVRRVCMIFGVDRVPLSDATTMRISYEHLKLPTIHGSPTLKFGFESNSPRPLVALKVIETLETFLSRFRSVHMALLDEIIFEDVAHISMEKALAPSGFASDYTAAMQNPKYSKKTWKDVVQCLNDLFLIDRARLEVFKQLICIRPLSGELVKDFADRIESMYRAAQAEAYGDIVIKAVLASLPISGYRTMERELGDLDHVKNMNVLLTQLRRHPDILDGTQKNPYDFWMKGVHAAPAKKAITAGHAPAPTAAKAITGPSRPATKPPSTSASPGNGSHYSSRHDSARASSPYAPSHYNDSSGHRREHGGKPYDRPPSTFSSDKLCQLPTCVERRLKHRADRCYSVTDPKRYNAMLKGNKHRP